MRPRGRPSTPRSGGCGRRCWKGPMSTPGLELDGGERDRLFGLAYRMLGRAADAEDAVQETFLRWAAADHASIENPSAWLTTVCTRVCLDVLRSARAKRERY